jgi:hypothetical protein
VTRAGTGICIGNPSSDLSRRLAIAKPIAATGRLILAKCSGWFVQDA